MMPFSIAPYIGTAAGALVIILITVIVTQYYRLGKMEEEMTMLQEQATISRVTVDIQRITIGDLQLRSKQMITSISALDKEVKNAQEKEKSAILKYAGYQGRLYEASLKKPELVEIRANRAIRGIMQQFETATDRSDSIADTDNILPTVKPSQD